MKKKKQPILTDTLYTEHSIPDVLQKYEELLKEADGLDNLQHATFINQYRNIVIDTKFLGTLRKYFNEFYKLIEREFPETMFHLEGRRKSLISTEKKILKSLAENKSLDTLRDLIAFRIIIFDKNNKQEEAVNLCYSIMNKVIEFGIKNGFMLCEANPVDETYGFDNSKHKIFIPSKSGIPNEFAFGVKDYILNPKRNGYQSLHCAFRLASGHCFEVQIRTHSMHIHAESGEANHDEYKEETYSTFEFEKSKIQIPGYGVSENGTVHDMVGLEKALLVLQRQRTFVLNNHQDQKKKKV